MILRGLPERQPSSLARVGRFSCLMTAHSARILVVDDESVNRRLMRAILEVHGYEVIEAADGPTALALIAGGALDLVLLDVMMPGIDGIEVCRRVRGELARPFLPVIVITALSDAESRTRAKAAGANDVLGKPIHLDELIARS